MKRLFQYCVVAALFISSFIVSQEASAASFSDVNYYKEEIMYLTNQGTIKGYPDGTFKPSAPITRYQAVSMLIKAKGLPVGQSPNPNLADVNADSWLYEEVATAVEYGLISGKPLPNGQFVFDAGGNLTRGQMAKLLVKMENLPLNEEYLFPDVAKGTELHKQVSAIATERITAGYPDGTFGPQQSISREHFSVFVARVKNPIFRPAAVGANGTYEMKKNKAYSWRYYEGMTQFESVVKAKSGSYEGPSGWNLWLEQTAGDSHHFITFEDQTGLHEKACYFAGQLYCGEATGPKHLVLKYPISVGRSWIEPRGLQNVTYTITAINQQVQTKDRLFQGATKVEASDGWIYYYVKEIGLVQSIENGKVYAELEKIQ